MWQRNKRGGREAPGGKAGNFGIFSAGYFRSCFDSLDSELFFQFK